MFNNNHSISISVSDDEVDEQGKMRVRVRRKRKKPGYRDNNDLTRRAFRLLVKFWMVLIFLPAAVFLLYEASKISIRPSLEENTRQDPVKKLQGESHVNLNHTGHKTRIGGGGKERCLKLLPPEELEHLDIPPTHEDPSNPLRSLIYISEKDNRFLDGTTHPSQKSSEVTRFNLFTGNQTHRERDISFKVNENAGVHCGFYSDKGGFEIQDKDRSYMETCKVVVSTCAFGGGDDLHQPIGVSGVSLQKVCFVAFWDDITLEAQQSVGHIVGENNFIGKWRIVVVKNLPFSDQRLNGKIPKMLAHRLFLQAKFSIWVDSKSQFKRDPLGVLEALLSRSQSVLAISEHGARNNVYEEAKAVVRKNKATPKEVEIQLNQYRRDGLPAIKRFNGKKALAEASVIVREHTAITNQFMCLWFNEVVRFTSRDQLSFPYVLWRFQELKNINMFPVCTRKDLVNSIGHVRKAKPLKA